MSLAYLTYKSSSPPSRPMLSPLGLASSPTTGSYLFHSTGYHHQTPSRNMSAYQPQQISFLSSPPPTTNSLFASVPGTTPTRQPFFSFINKISAISLERRIDFHLQRIMKQSRLINFKNSIEALPVEHRIAESLLEIIISSNCLIARRQSLIQSAVSLLTQLRNCATTSSPEDAFSLLYASLSRLKDVCSSLGQVVWALNSNKEHIKYVVRVYALPDIYLRPGPDEEHIPLKERISQMVALCEATMEQCNTLKTDFHQIIIEIFIAAYPEPSQ